jgi:hypothetical protein
LISGEAVAARVRAHLDGCSECRQRLDFMEAEVMSLRRNLRGGMTLPDPGPAPDGGADTEDDDATDPNFWDSPEPGRSTEPGPGRMAQRGPAAVGKYLVIGLLDAGGQAEVYRVVPPR